MRKKGKITTWNTEKGYGFITPTDGGKQLFVHCKAFTNRQKQPEINERVTYAIAFDNQGRPCAEAVTRVGEVLSNTASQGKRPKSMRVAGLFLAVVGLSALSGLVPFILLPFYGVVSLVTFLLYAMDKSAAQKGSWRTQESTLHLFALAGGWPGALVAQQTLRHKSQKQSFRLVFWVTVALNLGLFSWLYTPAGAEALQTFIGGYLK